MIYPVGAVDILEITMLQVQYRVQPFLYPIIYIQLSKAITWENSFIFKDNMTDIE